jgi:hypothetical protein
VILALAAYPNLFARVEAWVLSEFQRQFGRLPHEPYD